MLDLDWAAAAVEGYADGVEADLGVVGSVAPLAHPGNGKAADTLLLAAVDAEDRALGAEGGTLTTGLDLDEYERAAVEGDDVELAETGAGVALDDLPASRDQPGGDQVLGSASNSLSLNGHPGRR